MSSTNTAFQMLQSINKFSLSDWIKVKSQNSSFTSHVSQTPAEKQNKPPLNNKTTLFLVSALGAFLIYKMVK